MSAKSSGDMTAVADALRAAGKLLVTTHVRADGDALGSMLALHAAARLSGRQSRMVLAEAVGGRYRFLFRAEQPVCLTDPDRAGRQFAELAAQAERVVIVDTCAFGQLTPIADALRPCRQKIVVIDHHATADDVGAVAWRDPDASAAGVMVARLLEALAWPTDKTVAEALAVAVYTDTGWLRYANTTPEAMNLIARLIAGGVRPEALYGRIYQTDRPQRVRLLASALGSLCLHADDRLALMTLSQEDFARTGASEDETEDFVNEPLRIGSVEVSALLTEQANGVVRGSLRSRSLVDVAAVAGRFAGGGHARAAGFRAEGKLDIIQQQLIDACAAQLRGKAVPRRP